MSKLSLHLPEHGSRGGKVHYTSYRVPFETAKTISQIARSASLELTKGEREDAISQTEATIQILEQSVPLFKVNAGVKSDPHLHPSKHAREATPKKGAKTSAKKETKAKAPKVAKAKVAKTAKATKAKPAKMAKAKGKSAKTTGSNKVDALMHLPNGRVLAVEHKTVKGARKPAMQKASKPKVAKAKSEKAAETKGEMKALPAAAPMKKKAKKPAHRKPRVDALDSAATKAAKDMALAEGATAEGVFTNAPEAKETGTDMSMANGTGGEAHPE